MIFVQDRRFVQFAVMLASVLLPLSLSSCRTGVSDADAAQLIFINADVVTMNEGQPSAQAVSVKAGKILAVGSTEDLTRKYQGQATQVVDLHGKALLPGFIDPHSHFMNALQISTWANVTAPPVGQVKSIPDIIAVLKEYQAKQKIAKGEWIIGYGYDSNELAEKRELTRDDLDPAFPDNPVMLIHISNHGAVLNSAAFKKMNISAATPTPPGGVILRKPGSKEPAGLLMETAFLPIFASMPQPSENEMLDRVKTAQDIYASNGYTTAQEGATGLKDLNLLKKAASQNRLFLDVDSLPLVTELPSILKEYPPSTFGSYDHRLKLAGVKALIDGSPQAKTAFFTTPYLTGGPSGEKNWVGEPTFPEATFLKMMKVVYENNLRIFNHCNGDAAIDLFLRIHQKLGGKAELRPVIIHSQFVRRDQLDTYVKLGIVPSMFTLHTYFFGDVHVKNRGMQQASFISPMNTAMKMGLHVSNHSDFSVLPLDPMFIMWTAMNRTTRSGVVLGPEERITAYQALKAITTESAYEYMEEGSKGSIEPGKLADLVVLSGNPLKVQGDAIKAIKVEQTFKEGNSVYQRKE